ncbi:MAG: hypothetical protein ACRDYY_10820, partial [Acidimicrobiales bacterium]
MADRRLRWPLRPPEDMPEDDGRVPASPMPEGYGPLARPGPAGVVGPVPDAGARTGAPGSRSAAGRRPARDGAPAGATSNNVLVRRGRDLAGRLRREAGAREGDR